MKEQVAEVNDKKRKALAEFNKISNSKSNDGPPRDLLQVLLFYIIITNDKIRVML